MSSSLAVVFQTHVKNPEVSRWASQAIELRLHEILRTCRATWPGLDVPEHAFVRHLAEHLPDEGEPARCLSRMSCADLYLACGCAVGLPAAIALLDREVLGKVPSTLQRMGLSSDRIDDVLQVVRTKLLLADGQRTRPMIASYAGRGSLVGWVRIAARRAAISMGRNMDEQVQNDEEQGALECIVHPSDMETKYLEARYQAEFKRAIEDALGMLDSRQRNILRFHYVDGLSIDRIGALLQVHRATAARWIRAAADAVRTEAWRLLRERLGLSDGEIDSLGNLFDSQLHVSISRLLESR